jgi:hypothetical protein
LIKVIVTLKCLLEQNKKKVYQTIQYIACVQKFVLQRLSGYSNAKNQKMGRWQGATFKEYIQEELANYLDGMSMAMKTKFNFMNIAGNAFSNITDTVLTIDYNSEFILATAA